MRKKQFATNAIVLFVFAFSPQVAGAVDFSAEATALPFPPDAKALEFTAWTERINFTSQSPLKSLAAFYLQEMAARGWEHDASEVDMDDDSIEMTFRHGDAEVEVDLNTWSKEIRVTLNCDELDFNGIEDPAALAAAGIPVPRAALFMQKEMKLPAELRDLQYKDDGVSFKAPSDLQATFDNLSQQIKAKGYRESRRPIVNATRRYTEFKKGSIELSVNVFTHEYGSRAIVGYENQQRQRVVPPLPAVASLPIHNPGESADEMEAESLAEEAPNKTPINVTTNKGQAIVTYGSRKYTFAHVASFQTKDRGDYATEAVFAAKPIPLNKMQALINSKNDFSLGDLYEFGIPNYLIIQLGEYHNLSFSADGTGIGGYDIENATGEMKVVGNRVVGKIEMPPKEILNRPLLFVATIDAALITPNTRISTAADDSVEESHDPVLADSPVPMPEGVEDLSRSGSNFRKEYLALAPKPLADVASFYRKQLAAQGWQSVATSNEKAMQFKNDTMELLVNLQPQGNKTSIEVVTREAALAKKEGLLPEPGKGRLVLANAHRVDVLMTIGKTDYPLKAGRGAEDIKQALNYSLPPGVYNVVIKIPGQQPQSEKIDLQAGATWGIIALPTGGYLPMQMY